MITRQLEGRRSMNVVKLGAAAEANWKSSITITTGSPSAARSFTIAIATSPSSGSASESKSVASSQRSGHRRASAAVSADQNVAGSASRSSHESQIDASVGAIVQPGSEHDALACPGRADDDRQRDVRTCVEGLLQAMARNVPARERGWRKLRRGQQSRSQDPVPLLAGHPRLGDSRSPHRTAYCGHCGSRQSPAEA